MKKIFATLMISLFIINVFGQLITQTVEQAHNYVTVYKFWRGLGEIRYFDSTSNYILFGASTNQFESTMHSIVLGQTKEEAIKSLQDLQALKKQCKEELVVYGANNSETHIFRAEGTTVFATHSVAGYSFALYYLKIDKAIEAVQNFNE